MNWLEFSIDATSEFVEPIVETLMKFAHGGVSIENQSINPMDAKKSLAKQIVTQMYDNDSAILAQNEFESVVQKKEIPIDIDEISFKTLDEIAHQKLSNFLAKLDLAKSSSEARRLISQNAVSINNEIILENLNLGELGLNQDNLLKIGRNKYVKLLINEISC